MESKKISLRCTLALCAFILIAFALRAYQLGAQDIWWDEGRNIFTASRPLAQIATAPELDIHPPLYFYLLHFWIGVAGLSEFATRFFSLGFGVATVALAFRLGAYVANRRAGLWAVLITALAPLFVDEAQQIRMYTLVIFFSALSIYFLARAVQTNRAAFWIIYALIAVASFYTHYSFIYILAAQNLYLFFRALQTFRARADTRGLLTRWIASQVAIAALYLFQLPTILRQTQVYGNPSMTPPPLSQYATELARAFLLGAKIEDARVAPVGLGIIVAILAALAAVYANRREKFAARGVGLLFAWLAVPLAAYFLVLQVSPQFTPRYVMIATLPLYLLFSIALAQLARRSLAAGALVALIWIGADAFALQSNFTNPAFFNDDTRGVAQFIAEKATRDDLVLIDVPFPFDYYYRGVAPTRYFFVDIHTAADELTRLAQNKRRVFWIRWSKSDTDPRGVVLFLLDKYAAYAGETSFRGYEVVWYEMPRDAQFALAPAPQAVSANFGEKILLTGYAYGGAAMLDVNAPRAQVGGKAWVVLWWKIIQPVKANYKVSIQLNDARGNVIAQDDRLLINDRHFGTRLWRAEEIAVNVYTLELIGISPGDYTLKVIVYDPESGTRLPVGSGDMMPLGSLQVMR
ncbi:MAG: glycosyltransferase family 39 protein [Chloroflexi bacterium]|nr:glycosyltransferase family 39 protein [Chloroflexota bacterium]